MVMMSLLVLLLSPLLCRGASVPYEEQWRAVTPATPGSVGSCPGGSSCSVLRNTVELLKVVATACNCPGLECNCDTGSAEEKCMWYVASVLRHCTASSYPDQATCVKQELSSGFPAGMVPCSSDAAVCTAIAAKLETATKAAEGEVTGGVLSAAQGLLPKL